MSEEKKVILVTGATGNVGRQVVSQLLSAGARVRALTRNPDSADLPQEVEVVRGDMSAPETLDGRRLEGVEAVFLVWRSMGVDAAPFVNAVAKRARRIVFLSSAAVRDDVGKQTNPIGQAHADIERLIENSGLEWTHLRPGGFATNARWWWGPQIRVGDVVRWPYGDAAWAPIDERDIAAVAVRALTEKGQKYIGGKYYLTGEQSLSQIEQVKTIGEAIGRPLRFEELTPEAAREPLSALFSPMAAEMMLSSWAKMSSELAVITNTVAEITGVRARTFRQWAIEHAGEFRKEN
jgi:uncharacterized protein YbjT (DUF2867 family)